MSTAYAFADETASAYGEPVDTLEEVLADDVVSPDELPRLQGALVQFRGLEPEIEEAAVTLRSLSQMARVGVTRFPLAHTRREIADLIAYKAARAGAKNVTSFNRRKKNRASSGNDNAA